MMEMRFGTVSRDARTGKLGARVQLSLTGEYAGYYEFDTHGMSPDDVAAKVAERQDHHAKKCVRLRGFAGVIGVEIVIATRLFRIIDCTVRELGERVELYVDVRELAGEQLLKVDGFPITQRYASIDEVLGNMAIVAIARGLAQSFVTMQTLNANYVSQVTQLVGIATPGGTP